MKFIKYLMLFLGCASLFNVVNALFFLGEAIPFRILGAIEVSRTVFVLYHLAISIVCFNAFRRYHRREWN
jgi:hypothetical protein